MAKNDKPPLSLFQ